MIDALQKRFRIRFVETARKRIRAALDGITRGGPEGMSHAAMELHSLAGEAGTLGYTAIAELALQGEQRAGTLVQDPAASVACLRLIRDLGHAVGVVESEDPDAPAKAPPPEQLSVQRRRVLVVDDSAINGEALVEALEEASLEARSVLGPAAALAEVEHFRPDVVLADVLMPGSAPAELCRQLRARAGDRTMCVLFVSALGEDALAELTREAGADGFVPKDRGLEAVVRRVKASLQEPHE
jgi:CheY-like chemotaxis protein